VQRYSRHLESNSAVAARHLDTQALGHWTLGRMRPSESCWRLGAFQAKAKAKAGAMVPWQIGMTCIPSCASCACSGRIDAHSQWQPADTDRNNSPHCIPAAVASALPHLLRSPRNCSPTQQPTTAEPSMPKRTKIPLPLSSLCACPTAPVPS
jgi:hypothetical protein